MKTWVAPWVEWSIVKQNTSKKLDLSRNDGSQLPFKFRNSTNSLILLISTFHLSPVEKLQNPSRDSNSLGFFRLLSFGRGRCFLRSWAVAETLQTWWPRRWRTPSWDNVYLRHHSWLCAESCLPCVLQSLITVTFVCLCVGHTECNEAVAVTSNTLKVPLKYACIMSVPPTHVSPSGLLKHLMRGWHFMVQQEYCRWRWR